MKFFRLPELRRVLCALLSLAIALEPLAASAAQLNLVKTPLFVSPPIPPYVMLDISKDQQLHKKAYNDYSDLDGDGTLELTYKHSIDYYGYFDSYKCYDYVAGNSLEGLNHYAPVYYTSDKYCDGTKWSGNFLNWATMTRMDTVRKLLFGGLRRDDLSASPSGVGSSTVLERSHLTPDAHSFAKWYGGSDVNRLSPFGVRTTPTTGALTAAGGTTARAPTVDFNTATNPLASSGGAQVVLDHVPNSFASTLSPGDQIVAQSDIEDASSTASDRVYCTISGRLVGNNVNTAGAGGISTLTLWVDKGGSFVELDYSTTPPTAIPGTSTGGSVPLNCTPKTGSPATTANWTLTNLTSVGISICNTTPALGYTGQSEAQTTTPRMRMVAGNYELWAANELKQCLWHDEGNNLQGGFITAAQKPSSNGNQQGLSGLSASAENPRKATGSSFAGSGGTGNAVIPARSLGVGVDLGEYRVLVEACSTKADSISGVRMTPTPPGQRTTERCKQYDSSGDYKPIGLLQVYGDDGRINFGLMTGSYAKNISGGVLRKNPGTLSDEVNSSGQFTAPASSNGSGIITTLSRLRMYGYNYGTGLYNNAPDNCPYQLTSSDLADGKCRSWGNPMSEIYAESLRYFAGANAPTTAFNTDDSGLISGLKTATWPNPNNILTNNNYCAPLNVLVFNASVSSKDHDQVPSDPFNGAISGFTPASFTDQVGTAEGLPNKSFFVGQVGATGNQVCDAKPFTSSSQLGTVQGLCPEAPSLNGTYLMAGLAYAARTNRIRSDLTSVPTTDKTSLKVNTYGISLATNVPRIEVGVPGSSTGQKIIIQPVYRLHKSPGAGLKVGSGAIVDVKIVFQRFDSTKNANVGRMYVNWEDSEQGGDYDQDMWGVIDYEVSATTAKVTTNVISASTANGQGFGYVISGTTQDGPHFHSGIYNFYYTADGTAGGTSLEASPGLTLTDEAAGVTIVRGGTTITTGYAVDARGGCKNCTTSDVAVTANYTVSSAGAAQALNDPLWFAAKYGGFTDSDNNKLPNVVTEWDNFVNSTGAVGSDGIPDNFFLVSNPLGLEAALDKLFISILQASAASAVAANSSKLNTSTRIYQAVFNPSDWSGKLLAFGVDATTGAPNTSPDWDGGQVSLNATTVDPSARVIVTFNKGVAGTNPRGIPFRWPSNPASPTSTELTDAQVAYLRTNPDTGTVTAAPSPYDANSDEGNKRLLYLRGDGTNEGLATTNFRRRPTTKLGDIINSNPNFVGPPAAGYPDASYRSFASTYSTRKPMLFVGANDGMLHAFDASLAGTPGKELLAYIPSTVYRNLSKLTSRSYSSRHEYFVDGSPAVEDAQIGTTWKTVLVGGLNRGGQGIYALDVTDPTSFSETNAANMVLWEFTDADDPDLGYTFGTPVIRKMANGKWAAIFSGGYNNSQGTSSDPAEVACSSGLGTLASPYSPAGCSTSLTGNAYIFIVFLDGPSGTNGTWVLGTDYIKLQTNTGSVGTPNGFGSPLAADSNGDGKVDLIYAGDLLGGLWKFDVSSSTATNWTNSSNRLNLFNAVDASGTAQPITSGPEAVLHPSGNGIIVSFGTGKYLEATDISSSTPPSYQTQSLYGIWDLGATVSGRSSLMPQLLQPGITNIVTNPDGSVSRITTRHQPNYTSSVRTSPDATQWDGASALENKVAAVSTVQSTPANQRGWYLDLFNAQSSGIPAGERVIYAPFVKNGIVFYSTLWPLGNSCLGSTAGDNLTLNITTGARPDASVFDITGDALVNSSDLVNVGNSSSGSAIKIAVSSRRIDGGSAQPPTLVSKGTMDVGYQNTTSGNLSKVDLYFGRGPGRVTWREILY